MIVKLHVSEILECEIVLLGQAVGSLGSLRKQCSKLQRMIVAMPLLSDTASKTNFIELCEFLSDAVRNVYNTKDG